MKEKVTIIDKILANRVLTHVLGWVGIVIVWVIYGGLWGNPLDELLINKLCYLPPQIIATYWLIYYQIPKLVFQKKYLRFAVSFVVSVYLTTVLARILKIYVYETTLGADLPKDRLIPILTEIAPLLGQYLLWVYLIPFIILIVKFIKDHFEEKRQMEKLQKEKAIAELNFLKAQIHPHFLFNTLNNLYTLTLYKSETAPALILQLSDIIDYMFNQCQGSRVLVTNEVKLLRNYIDLELLRYGERLVLVFEHKIDDPASEIAPLILLSIVENAFKHGASGDIGNPKIHIHLRVENKQLYFKVFNTKARVAQMDSTSYKKGIGVNNIKRQLELIYPNHYELTTNEQADTYEFTLQVQLYAKTLQLAI